MSDEYIEKYNEVLLSLYDKAISMYPYGSTLEIKNQILKSMGYLLGTEYLGKTFDAVRYDKLYDFLEEVQKEINTEVTNLLQFTGGVIYSGLHEISAEIDMNNLLAGSIIYVLEQSIRTIEIGLDEVSKSSSTLDFSLESANSYYKHI